MSILAQHGWGKATKIQRGIDAGSICGLVMSPRDESPDALASFLSTVQGDYPSVERIVDPQLYAGTIWPVRDGRLTDYPYYKQRLAPVSFSPGQIQWLVKAALDWQAALDISAVVSPTVRVDALGSQWAQIAMMLAQETVARHDGEKPLLISLVVDEDALRQRSLVNEWLNDLTLLDVDGFYLVVRRTSETYRQHYEPDVLASLLGICYSLAELNEYRVFVGYTDITTMLFHAVGVTATCAGWYVNLRQFNLRRFEPVSGGRPARARYSSSPLLNCIYMTELDGIYNGGRVADVLSRTPFDASFNGNTNPENVPWPVMQRRCITGMCSVILHDFVRVGESATAWIGFTVLSRRRSPSTRKLERWYPSPLKRVRHTSING